jgi:hypothetical protein
MVVLMVLLTVALMDAMTVDLMAAMLAYKKASRMVLL